MPLAEKLVILDRDGVINQDSDDYVKSLDEFLPYPQAITAIARLSQAGWTVVVATNQSGIARGYYDEATLAAMHERLNTLVADAGGQIAAIAHCPHGPSDGCECRKPLPGLLKRLGAELGIEDLTGGWMVGDSLRDLEAGEAVGCHPVLVRTGKGERTLAKYPELTSDGRTSLFDDLAAFVDWLLEKQL
ncbi:D-glycero-beta-D-manno-heptose 1,7-bisphosphate 7-phosphatase [Halomonas organivorans]|uniref:D,D-heptose 1,7-bisphosphate phosphatase n=1 Tax=Halomonas organivorans TaxID=257772 RepID=A0A7W5G635_9GAMM|nr:D-glycero-beta-D-manno-heptose 1,7-bisphosphate 7-phosphatase [Halomonas organivorans]MBB3141769.1 D-glycero-D-manno-heptose 1,7-bisphosphate phosphatase [Halomonas organivorans]